jgi:hypothetical protein
MLLTLFAVLSISTNKRLNFQPDGTFKILHISDTHIEIPEPQPCQNVTLDYPCDHTNTTNFVRRMIAIEKPDLVVRIFPHSPSSLQTLDIFSQAQSTIFLTKKRMWWLFGLSRLHRCLQETLLIGQPLPHKKAWINCTVQRLRLLLLGLQAWVRNFSKKNKCSTTFAQNHLVLQLNVRISSTQPRFPRFIFSLLIFCCCL